MLNANMGMSPRQAGDGILKTARARAFRLHIGAHIWLCGGGIIGSWLADRFP